MCSIAYQFQVFRSYYFLIDIIKCNFHHYSNFSHSFFLKSKLLQSDTVPLTKCIFSQTLYKNDWVSNKRLARSSKYAIQITSPSFFNPLFIIIPELHNLVFKSEKTLIGFIPGIKIHRCYCKFVFPQWIEGEHFKILNLISALISFNDEK